MRIVMHNVNKNIVFRAYVDACSFKMYNQDTLNDERFWDKKEVLIRPGLCNRNP